MNGCGEGYEYDENCWNSETERSGVANWVSKTFA